MIKSNKIILNKINREQTYANSMSASQLLYEIKQILEEDAIYHYSATYGWTVSFKKISYNRVKEKLNKAISHTENNILSNGGINYGHTTLETGYADRRY